MQGASPDTAAADIPGCLYSNKSCANPRTTKKDGSLHRLCAYHQERANSRQKQYLRKRKQMEEGGVPPPPPPRTRDALPARPATAHITSATLRGIEPIAFDAEEATLSDTEVQMLAASMTATDDGGEDDDDDDYEDDDDVDFGQLHRPHTQPWHPRRNVSK